MSKKPQAQGLSLAWGWLPSCHEPCQPLPVILIGDTAFTWGQVGRGAVFLPRGGGHTSELGPPGHQSVQKPHDWLRGGHICPLWRRGWYRKEASCAGCPVGHARHCQHLAQTFRPRLDSEAGLASRHLWWAAPSQSASLPAETGLGHGPPLMCGNFLSALRPGVASTTRQGVQPTSRSQGVTGSSDTPMQT